MKAKLYIKVGVKIKIPPRFFFFCAVFFLLMPPAHAATQTLTTYYPVPSGNYNKLQTNSMRLTASTLVAIQAQYKCSFDPAAGLSPCPAGLMYFDTDAQSIYVSTGTSWTTVNATCIPVTPCSDALNCSNDNCGNKCGSLNGKCPQGQMCNSSIPGIPGSCISGT